MLGMCGRQQHERRGVLFPDDRASSNLTQTHFIPDHTLIRTHQDSRLDFVTKTNPPVCVFPRRPRSTFDVAHPAEAEMVRSVVGGTVSGLQQDVVDQ